MTNIWFCKIGENTGPLPSGADAPMRAAIREAYLRLTGHEPDFIFSGWGGELTEGERAVHENREPRNPPPQPMTFLEELATLLNRNSMEQRSNTPDFILAEYMLASLRAFENATIARKWWYGSPHSKRDEVPNQSTSRIRPHDTGPDYKHGPGCLCRYCDNK